MDAYRALAALYNLNVSIADTQQFARPNETVAYSITYANTGSTAMGNTVLSVTVPANTTYVSSTPGFTSQGGGVYTLNLGTLASNQTGNVTFRVQVSPGAAGQTITFNATIGGTFPESNTADNSATDTFLVTKSESFLPMIRRLSSPQ